MSVIFQAWGYEVTFLELIAVITSLVAVYLGALGTRKAWPWWILSSFLYGVFFFNVDLIASSILQLVFIAAAIWGWLGWNIAGVEPRFMTLLERIFWLIALLLTWFIAAPALADIGAAASWPDSFLLVASTIAQIVMVLQRNETWILWLVIDAFGTWHYARQSYYFTALLYFIFTLIAIFGWVRWRQLKRD